MRSRSSGGGQGSTRSLHLAQRSWLQRWARVGRRGRRGGGAYTPMWSWRLGRQGREPATCLCMLADLLVSTLGVDEAKWSGERDAAHSNDAFSPSAVRVNEKRDRDWGRRGKLSAAWLPEWACRLMPAPARTDAGTLPNSPMLDGPMAKSGADHCGLEPPSGRIDLERWKRRSSSSSI